MNLSQGIAILDALSASLEHGDDAAGRVSEEEEDLVGAEAGEREAEQWEAVVGFGQRKKFLDPNPISFSLGSKPDK